MTIKIKSQHTPGPWEMLPNGIIQAQSREHSKSIGQFTGMASTQQHVEEHKPNCRLIAAAPELLAVLETIDQFWSETPMHSCALSPDALIDDNSDGRIQDLVARAVRMAKGISRP